MRCLCELIGSQGVQFLDTKLSKMISNSVLAMKEIINANQVLIEKMKLNIEQDLKNFIDVGKKLSSVEDFTDYSISIGFISKFRELLFSAMADVFESKIPVLPAITRLLDGKQSNEQFKVLKNRLGLIANDDINLKASLNSLTMERAKYCWTQFPYMYGYVLLRISLDPCSHILGTLEGIYS